MSSVYQPRHPRASPLWQIIHHGWDDFLARYEKHHRKSLGPLPSSAVATVQSFLRCGDLASGFTRLQCTDCGHERLLAFTCKGRHFCPSCHQRRVRSTSDWIATAVCHEVPHRQFVFTIPRVLRGIFRKRRRLLTLLFHTATNTLQDAFRTRLNLPQGRIGAIAAVHTFGDYLIFHPHLHLLAADGLFTSDGRFHCMPAEDLAPAIELFRHRFLQALRDAKIISPSKLANLLAWKHSGFNIHNGGEQPVPAHDTAGRKRLAEYLLRHPFSLQKITWNATSKTVIYRSKRHHTTKRNFEIFKAPDFIAAALLHLPPKGQQTVRYYGLYS
ncbi:MAG: IS91 family transposase, partial [Verrucomicrobiales bacterium]